MKRVARFNPGEAISRAEEALSRPPPLARIVRPRGIGRRVARFALPLDAVKPQNRKGHGDGWRYARDNARVALLMRLQCPAVRGPLTGRPQVLCTRFSSVEPDAYNDGFKSAVDVLTLPKPRSPNRLGLIVDDRPSAAQVVQWWEPAPPRRGFAYIEVWTGEA